MLRTVLLLVLLVALVVWAYRSGRFHNLLKFAPLKSAHAESIPGARFRMGASRFASLRSTVVDAAATLHYS
ncbi:MAG TPA: hypothetical protein VGR81_06655 [Candidatus Acidoferrales bacterium]|nr:hypothetical protein [Candidatus Acidoferrales bacterium]